MATAIIDMPAPFDVSFDFHDDYQCVGSLCMAVEDTTGAPDMPAGLADGTRDQFFDWFDGTFGDENDFDDDPWSSLRKRTNVCRNYSCDCACYAWESDKDYFDELLAGFDRAIAFKEAGRYEPCEQIVVPTSVDAAHQMSSRRPDGWDRLKMTWDGDTLCLTFSGSSGRWSFECLPFDPDRSRLAEIDDSCDDWPRASCPAERVATMTRPQAKLVLAYIDMIDEDRDQERGPLEDIVDQVVALFPDPTAVQVATGIIQGWNSDLDDLAVAVNAVLNDP